MFFLISIILAISLGYIEIQNYGKLVPANAITKQTKLSKIIPLLVQRIASASASGIILEFFNNQNNLFAFIFAAIFLVINIYFFAKTFFLFFIFVLRVIVDNHDDNPKPFQ
ncbi:hypothetical protein ABHA52_12395 [Enterococcus faecium]|uniref:hypothetical protein n=1 Tax=Enterococcus TaxID=1350 RepID=UPI001106681F|nr:hypothetical protein [Enterococcus faecium]MDB7485039.1 hypothetical protein [Enterococcus faecium]MDB7490093.1 hypothetical protein [Enterococcus faecium]MDB7492657.1 hypothetical protein [Enterococcus faecium]MDB7495251.1 hypothetical protein [Enterococcus faecium]MDB7497785.1 hypothetical protein [Enterococcus faecium]